MIAPGTRIGPYEISGVLGAGGMGEVYRALDTKLGREVAIKILPERFMRDSERRARFDREARVLASLNHPHIGAIYGIEEGEGFRALVLELIAGPTLADWLKDGPLPARDALRIAMQIASALAAAHERGIVHRDLKPANVILRGARRSTVARPPSGPRKPDSGPGGELTVKVVDFGLAKELETADAGADLADLPTRAQEATREGVLIGTVAYMSPEQARGERVDQRTDLWAFGCVLYEMLTGRPPFTAASLPDTLAAIVTKDPDWSALPGETSTEVRRILRRCLERDWLERLRDAGDLRLALADTESEAESSPPVASMAVARRPRRIALLVVPAALLACAMVGLLAGARWSALGGAAATLPSEMRLEVTTPPTYDPVSLAISPDGEKLAFVANSDGRSMLWVRSLDTTAARALPGTEGASFPFWSPDGQALGFFANGGLQRIDVALGAVQVIAPAEAGRGGAWGSDGSIIFQPSVADRALVRVAASGGPPLPFETLYGRLPQFLPDGRHFLYYTVFVGTADAGYGVNVAAVDGSGSRRLLEADGAAVYTLGYLLFVRGTTLLAQRFELATLSLAGDPFPVARDVDVTGALYSAPLSAATAGPIVFRTGTVGGIREFTWVDRAGDEMGTIGDPLEGSLSPSLSPDGRTLAFHRHSGGNNDIWLLDIGRGVLERFTTEPAPQFAPVWSADGARVAFTTGGDLVVRSIREGSASQQVLRRPEGNGAAIVANDWSADGRYLLFYEGPVDYELRVLPVDPPGEPIPFVEGRDGQFSPDGRWIAYTSDESGRPEVYVGRFPGAPAKVRVSTHGGGMARWRGDGRELFYVALDGRLMSVPLEIPPGGDALRPLAAVVLFDARIGSAVQGNSRQQYIVQPDGQRFLLNRIAEQDPPPITVLLNWRP